MYTAKERIEIYKKTIILIEKGMNKPSSIDHFHKGLCHLIPFSLEHLPELWAQAPVIFSTKAPGYWWDPENGDRRVKALSDAITLAQKSMKA